MHFLQKAHHNLLVLRTSDSTLLGGHFKQNSHQAKAQKCERHGTKKAAERTLVQRELKQEGSVASFSLSWKRVHRMTTCPHVMAKVPSVSVSWSQIHSSRWADLQTQDLQMMRINLGKDRLGLWEDQCFSPSVPCMMPHHLPTAPSSSHTFSRLLTQLLSAHLSHSVLCCFAAFTRALSCA